MFGASKSVTSKALALMALLLIFLAIYLSLPAGDWIRALVEWLRGFGAWGLVVLGMSYIVACVFMLPGSLLTLGAGSLAAVLWPEEPWLAVAFGTAAVSLGSVAGATAAFMLGRTLLRERVERRLAGNATFVLIDRAIGEQGLKVTLLVRLSPVFPFNVLNYALGLTRVRLRDFMLGSWAGMLPGTIMYVYLGTTLASLSGAAAPESNASGWAGKVMLAAGLLATLLLVAVITRAARRALARAVADEDQHES